MKSFSYSAVRDFRRCTYLHYYKRVMHLKKRGPARPLYVGSLVHEVVELYLKGERMTPRLLEIQEEYDKLWDEEKEEYGDVPALLRGIAKDYKETYPNDPAETVEVELEFEIPLNDDIGLKGKIDWIKRERGGLWVVDHKTTKGKIPTEGFRIFDLQTALYYKAAEVLGYDNLMGIGFNYIRSKDVTQPHLNKNGTMSKKKINTDINTLRKFMEKYHLDPTDYPEQVERAKEYTRFHRRMLPKPKQLIPKLVDDFITTGIEMIDPMPPVRDLRKECEYCEYYNLCIAELMDLDVDYLLKAEYKVVDDKEIDFTDVEEGGESTDDED